MKYGIVVAEFNHSITERMLESCLRGFQEQGIAPIVVKVPGAVEIPLAAQKLIEKDAPVAVVALGCVIKGETDHYKAVCEMCSNGIMEVMLKTGVPIIFEVLMTDSLRKAEERIEKGGEAARLASKLKL